MQKVKVISLNVNGIRAAKKKADRMDSFASSGLCMYSRDKSSKKDLDLSFFV